MHFSRENHFCQQFSILFSIRSKYIKSTAASDKSITSIISRLEIKELRIQRNVTEFKRAWNSVVYYYDQQGKKKVLQMLKHNVHYEALQLELQRQQARIHKSFLSWIRRVRSEVTTAQALKMLKHDVRKKEAKWPQKRG